MKRTHHPKEFKIQVYKEAIETGNATIVGHRYKLSSNMVNSGVKEIQRKKIQ